MEIRKYYNDLAYTYDEDRFNNTYGKYIHQQETLILQKLIKHSDDSRILDLACGTGRLSNFATDGSDLCENMINIAEKKYPNKIFRVEDATKSGWPENTFQTVFSFHMFMHLDIDKTSEMFQSISRLLKSGGRLIFDVPSSQRRKLSFRKQDGWHGNNAFTKKQILSLLGDEWELLSSEGILFFPIHRIPKKVRRYFSAMDSFFCSSFLKDFASYTVYEVQKK